jgi:hypothetical protein
VVALAAGAPLIAFAPFFWPVMAAQALIGGTSSVFIPALCAISLGIGGPGIFDARQGRNQAFNSADNVMAAVSMGLLGYFVSDRNIFFFVIALALPTILVLLMINPEEINYDLARGATRGEKGLQVESVRVLFRDHPLVIFLLRAVMFHFASAAMLPLLGELLAKFDALHVRVCDDNSTRHHIPCILVRTQSGRMGSQATAADCLRCAPASRGPPHAYFQFDFAGGDTGLGRRRGGNFRRRLRAGDC